MIMVGMFTDRKTKPFPFPGKALSSLKTYTDRRWKCFGGTLSKPKNPNAPKPVPKVLKSFKEKSWYCTCTRGFKVSKKKVGTVRVPEVSKFQQ